MSGDRRKELGIVLSGGGTRGVAHIGVLRALAERGIHPDRISGTSSGAIVGALYAAGYSPAEMLEFFFRKNPFHLNKLALSKPGFIDTDKVVADFEEYFPENSFEALQKPLTVVATDMFSGHGVLFDSGPLIRPVLASSSVPMVFTPMQIDGRLFADGGIVNNFPVEPLESHCDAILGVYCSPLRAMETSDLGSSIALLKRALEVGMFEVSQQKFERCRVVVCPDALGDFGVFETKRLRAIETVGYEAALRRMPEIKQALKGG